MQELHIQRTHSTPEIRFSPDENIFMICGISSPEDVRAMYYPVIEWVKLFIDRILNGEYKTFNEENPINFHLDLEYFNSSSAKFFFDILSELKKLTPDVCPVNIHWHYDEADTDMKEAGIDMASFAEMKFFYIANPK